jgi:hypothetical protein
VSGPVQMDLSRKPGNQEAGLLVRSPCPWCLCGRAIRSPEPVIGAEDGEGLNFKQSFKPCGPDGTGSLQKPPA